MSDDSFLPLWIYAAVGATILWAKMRRSKRDIYGLTEITKQYIPNEKVRIIVELAIFLIIGCLVSVGVINPSTPAQAFAAGLGWTGLATK